MIADKIKSLAKEYDISEEFAKIIIDVVNDYQKEEKEKQEKFRLEFSSELLRLHRKVADSI